MAQSENTLSKILADSSKRQTNGIGITVIMCTYNRSQSLAKALESVAACAVPGSVEWEVLVVDNNSNDKTREVVESFYQRFPGRFRYLLEKRQGLSCARNAGIHESRGEVLAFTDDDVIVEPSWLWNLTAELFSGDWAGAGGRIIPLWNSPPPRWLPVKERGGMGPFVAFDLGPDAIPLTRDPVGANMAFRREIFEKYDGFRTDLGRSAGQFLSHEDTEFGRRLLVGGEALRYEPSAVVHHPVPENRMTKKYQLAWWFDNGRSAIRLGGIQPGTRWSVGGVPIYLFRRFARWTVQWLISIKASKRFYYKLKAWGLAGQILECYQQSRGSTGHRRIRPDFNHGTE